MPTKVHLVKAMVFPVVMYGCESWTIKKAEHRRCFWTVVLEKTLESPLACKEIQPVHPKGDQSWIFTGRAKLWKILKEMGIPDHLICLLKNLCTGQEATVKTRHETTDRFKIGKGVHQGCILSPCLFNFMQSTSCEMPGWINHKQESRLLGEISTTSGMQIPL